MRENGWNTVLANQAVIMTALHELLRSSRLPSHFTESDTVRREVQIELAERINLTAEYLKEKEEA